jgi:hypothetical protein
MRGPTEQAFDVKAAKLTASSWHCRPAACWIAFGDDGRLGRSIDFSFASKVWDSVIAPICNDISPGAL